MQNKQIKRCQAKQGVVVPCGVLSSLVGKAQNVKSSGLSMGTIDQD